jgi:hypothetical protein
MNLSRSLNVGLAALCAALSIGSATAQNLPGEPLPLPFPIDPPRRVPAAPTPGAPVAGAHVGTAGNTRPVFTWTQGGWYVNQPGPIPTAQWFMVCIGTPAQVAACTWPGTWHARATAIPRVEIINQFTGISTGRFRYTYSPYAMPAAALSDTLLDQDLSWNVAACAADNHSSCSFGTAKAIRFSTRNLKGLEVTDNPSSDGMRGYITYTFTLSNTGTSNSGAFDTEVEFWQALEDGGACVRDPSHPALDGNDVAVLRDGRMIEISQLPANTVVEGFVHPNAMGSIKGSSTLTGLDPGNSTGVMTQQYSFPWGGMNDNYRAFVAVGRADKGAAVKEFDETDNMAGNCNVVGR